MPETQTPPAQPSTAAQTPPAPTPEAKPTFNQPFADLDELFKEPEPEPPPSPEPPKPAPKDPIPADKLVKPQDKTAPKPGEKPGEKPTAEPSGPKELRAAYERSKARIKELETSLESVRSAKPAEDPEKKTLSERLEVIEKQRKELEDELRVSAWERSPEFKREYAEPFEQAFKDAYAKIVQLTITDAEGNQAKATEQHLNALLRMGYDERLKAIETWFPGPASAASVAKMVDDIESMHQRKLHAIDQHRKQGEEVFRQRSEQAAKQQEQMRAAWKQHVQEGIDGHPDLFVAADDDPKGKELLTKGMQLADLAFSGSSVLPPTELVKVHAAIRNKAGGYDYLAYRWRQATKRIKELEAKIADYEKSEPGEGSGRRPAPGKAATWEEEIEALAREG